MPLCLAKNKFDSFASTLVSSREKYEIMKTIARD